MKTLNNCVAAKNLYIAHLEEKINGLETRIDKTVKLNGDIIDELFEKVKILEIEEPRNNLDDKVKDLEEKQPIL